MNGLWIPVLISGSLVAVAKCLLQLSLQVSEEIHCDMASMLSVCIHVSTSVHVLLAHVSS